jgi:biotin carboxylase
VPELLLIGVGLMGRPYVDAAHRLGVRVHAVERPGQDTGADHLTPVHGDSDQHWVAAAHNAVAARCPDGVIAFTEPQVLAAALVADELGLPGPGLRAAVVSRDKSLQRARFAEAGVRQPDHILVTRLADAAEWARQRFPVVVKSVSNTGSLGVELVADADGFAAAVDRRGGESPLLVESAVDGPEYSWEAVVVDGRVWLSNITGKQTSGPPRFIETGHRTGVRLGAADLDAVDAHTRSVLAALGMRSGMVHLEFRLAADGPTLMEVAVRTPGDYLMELLGFSYGVDWFEVLVRLALGWDLPAPPTGAPTPAAGHFPLAGPGVITAIEGLDEVRAHPAVVRAGVLAGVGDVLPPVVSSAQRRIYVLLSGADDAAVDDGLALAEKALMVRTRPE